MKSRSRGPGRGSPVKRAICLEDSESGYYFANNLSLERKYSPRYKAQSLRFLDACKTRSKQKKGKRVSH